MAAEPVIEEFAPAKVNLFLHVTGRRDDGYHLLDSLVAFADVGDRVTVSDAPVLSLSHAGPFADDLPRPAQNLIVKAATALRDAFGIDAGVAITLEKNLPVASGIGGGSADAAAAIRGMCRLWDIRMDDPRVGEVALSLGADVPVCVSGGTCIMRGIGEDLHPVRGVGPFAAVLVNPGLDVPTPAVFKARKGWFSNAVDWPDQIMPDDVIARLQGAHNDLEPPAIELEPGIGGVLTAISETPGVRFSRMSGSGATCFGLYEDGEVARAAAAQLKTAHQGWWAVAATIG